MTEGPLIITVDDREARTSRVADFLAANTGVQVTRKRLRVGDYLAQGRIIVAHHQRQNCWRNSLDCKRDNGLLSDRFPQKKESAKE